MHCLSWTRSETWKKIVLHNQWHEFICGWIPAGAIVRIIAKADSIITKPRSSLETTSINDESLQLGHNQWIKLQFILLIFQFNVSLWNLDEQNKITIYSLHFRTFFNFGISSFPSFAIFSYVTHGITRINKSWMKFVICVLQLRAIGKFLRARSSGDWQFLSISIEGHFCCIHAYSRVFMNNNFGVKKVRESLKKQKCRL